MKRIDFDNGKITTNILQAALPNKLLNAVIITMIGKHNPTAPKAAVPIFGILAI